MITNSHWQKKRGDEAALSGLITYFYPNDVIERLPPLRCFWQLLSAAFSLDPRASNKTGDLRVIAEQPSASVTLPLQRPAVKGES